MHQLNSGDEGPEGKIMKKFYLVFCVLGTVVPYWQLILWISENGFVLNAILPEIANSRLSLFAWLDVIISAIVLFGFIINEGKKSEIRLLLLPFVATLTVGVSLGLPLFLLLREIQLTKGNTS